MPASLLYYDQMAPSLDNGARILSSVVRPYPAKTCGIPLRFDYEVTKGTFTFEWANPDISSAKPLQPASVLNPPLSGHPPLTARETEIFVPSQLTHGRNFAVEGLAKADKFHYDERRQTLFIVLADMTPGKKNIIRVFVSPAPRPMFLVNSLWSDFGGSIVSFIGLVLSLLFAIVWATR
jgi:hypothetical protein